MNMVDLPLVTIVTPTYNQADFICETIESVLNQSYPNIEYIVINDGSFDETEEVLAKYNNKCTIIHQENMGQSETLNRGWEMAKGSIVGYISSDDRLKPECISEAVKAFSGNGGVVVTYCDFDLIDATGKYIRSVETEEFSVERLTEDLVCQPGPGAFFTKEVFNRVGGWDANLQHVADFEFWLRLCRAGRFKRIPKNLADFRIHKESASARIVSPSRSEEIVTVVREYADHECVNVNYERAVSCALLMSARSHLYSSRYSNGFKNILLSIKCMPRRIFGLLLYRQLFSGVLRRWYYSLRGIDV